MQIALVNKLTEPDKRKQIQAIADNATLLDFWDDRDALIDRGCDCEIAYGRVRPDEAEALRKLRWIHVPWTGVENVLHPVLVDRGVIITNTRGQSGVSMAEHAIGGLLYFARDLPGHAGQNAQAQWRRDTNEFLLEGSRVLVLGTGHIGGVLIPRLAALGVDVVGVNSDGRDVPGCSATYTLNDCASVLPSIDHLIVLLPATPWTRKVVDRDFLQALRPGAVVVNLSRGKVLDHEALLALLDTRHLVGAVLDVSDPEPLPADSPLWQHPRIMITGHKSWRPVKGVQDGFEIFLQNLRCFVDGKPGAMRNLVDPQRGY
jgi:phosphoglycerate dehydrogenase-like enzyme